MFPGPNSLKLQTKWQKQMAGVLLTVASNRDDWIDPRGSPSRKQTGANGNSGKRSDRRAKAQRVQGIDLVEKAGKRLGHDQGASDPRNRTNGNEDRAFAQY